MECRYAGDLITRESRGSESRKEQDHDTKPLRRGREAATSARVLA
jgi:hypothetical protein